MSSPWEPESGSPTLCPSGSYMVFYRSILRLSRKIFFGKLHSVIHVPQSCLRKCLQQPSHNNLTIPGLSELSDLSYITLVQLNQEHRSAKTIGTSRFSLLKSQNKQTLHSLGPQKSVLSRHATGGPCSGHLVISLLDYLATPSATQCRRL